MLFPLAVVHHTTDPSAAGQLLARSLEFEILSTAPAVVVSSGSLEMRILPVDREYPASTTRIEVRSADVRAGIDRMTSAVPATIVGPIRRPTPERELCDIVLPHGFVVVLTRLYDEDELGVVPDLPTNLEWDGEALDHVRHVLRIVPIAFRDTARIRVTQYAEATAVRCGEAEVLVEHAVRALLDTTPAFQHDALRTALAERGVRSEVGT